MSDVVSRAKNRAHWAICLILLLGGIGSVRAQGASPLAGKVVHLYNPFPGTLPLVDLSGTGYSMTEEGPSWYRFDFSSIGGSLQPWMNSFQIRTADWKRFGPAGLAQTDAPFNATVFGAGTDIWIMVDPAGPADAAPLILTKPPGTVHLFNPWPANGPKIVVNGAAVPMKADRNNCGWYLGYTLPLPSLNVYFTNVADGQAWGMGGYDDKTPFDLTALYASKGSDLWIAGQTDISGTNPGKTGSCTYEMAATVHDMAMKHPDYGGQGGLGMVETTLGPDRKPVPTPAALPNFNTWFNSDPNKPMPLKGAETCVNLEMGKSDDGLWEYDSFNVPVHHGYFPIDDFNVLDENKGPSCPEGAPAPPPPDLHNFGFCMESHANFVYQKGQVFDFRGDDDVWVFINNKLALDIGGIHAAKSGTIDLDTLGLIEGRTYPWDFFFCERQMCGSSLRIKTTIYFKQQRALDHEKVAGGGDTYRVIKRIGGTGACGSSSDSLKEVAPGPLTFILYRVGGDSIQGLPKGVSFGGIQVGDGTVSVDVEKITGLAAGQYRIVFFETASPRLRDEIRFTVPARNMVEYDPPYSVEAATGTVVRVIAANRFLDSLVAQAGSWTPIFPSGLTVYGDSSRTVPVASGSVLTTSSSGYDTLWVAGDPAALTDQIHTLSIPGSAKTVKITFKLPPLDLPKAVSADVYDDDGDGRGDRIEVVYDRDITASLPKSAAYRWPSSAQAVPLSGAELASRLDGGTRLVIRGAPLSASILTAGQGRFESTYGARGKDSVQILPIEDRIGPVIGTASMHLGPAMDTLHLKFSEPLSAGARAANPADLFGYRVGDASAALAIPPQNALWAPDGSAVALTFPSNASPAPKAGDFVRLNDVPALTDAGGNRPGPQSRFRIITGDKRTGIQTLNDYRVIPDEPALFPGPAVQPFLEPAGAKVKEVVERTGRLGPLLEADLADYAVGDGLTIPDPGQVSLEYDLALFTNLGVPVIVRKGSLACTDKDVFQGDCRAHRGRLFFGWNYTTESGIKVSTGAYVALFNFRIKVQGKTEAKGGIKQVWGILRRN
jgi:fibro-slime domain-containing protein